MCCLNHLSLCLKYLSRTVLFHIAGTYNDVLRSSTTAACTSCGEGYTTSGTGSLSSTECSMCLPGYGDEPTTTSNNPSCGSKCGGAAGATFGPVGREASTEGRKCLACPISTGFSFDYLAQNQLFVPETVARLGADSSADCLAEYAQIVDDVWFLGGDAALTTVETIGNGTTNITTVVECTEACSEDADCMFVTFSYDGQVCQKKVAEAGRCDGAPNKLLPALCLFDSYACLVCPACA